MEEGDTMEEIFQWLCGALKDLFFKGFGDYRDTQGGDVTCPASSEWQVLVSMNKPCTLYIRNLDASNEVMITWNRDNSIGAKIKADKAIVLDNVTGLVYVRTVNSTLTASVNYLAIALKTNV